MYNTAEKMIDDNLRIKQKIYLDLAIGLIAVVLLLFVKTNVESSYIGHWFNSRGYEFLHKLIPPFNRDNKPSVAVIDISEVKRNNDGTTPIRDLQEIIEGLIACRAKAIAIDIDFSTRRDTQNPSNTGPRAEDDPMFFEFLHEINKKGVPVFVGAFNFGPESTSWLGLQEDKDLAADMTIFDEDTTQVPMWFRCEEGEKLNSISNALAEASGKKVAPNSLLKRLLEDPEEPGNIKPTFREDKSGKLIPCQRAFTLVNYAKLELMQDLTLQTINKDAVLKAKDDQGKSRFENKLVIIGNTQRGIADDCFVVIGRQKPVAGSYIHASAVYSLVDEPVYKLKHGVIIVLDILLGLSVILGLFIVRLRHFEERQFPSHLWESRFILFSIIITLLLGVLLVRFFHVLWLDFFMVVFALLLHSKVQEGIHWIPAIFFIKKKRLPTKR